MRGAIVRAAPPRLFTRPSTGDKQKWLITTKASIDGPYDGAKRNILKSSFSSTPCKKLLKELRFAFEARWPTLMTDTATWFNRASNDGDPRISMYVLRLCLGWRCATFSSFFPCLLWPTPTSLFRFVAVKTGIRRRCKLRTRPTISSRQTTPSYRYKGQNDGSEDELVKTRNGVNVFIRSYTMCRKLDLRGDRTHLTLHAIY
jgi:hypothetical protein